MTLLVTGGCGFIGSALIRQAVARGRRVVNYDALTYAANPQNLTTVAASPLYQFVEGDIRAPVALTQVFDTHQPDAVLHLAAETHVDRSIDGPEQFIDTNLSGTGHLLEAARQYWTAKGRPDGFRFHHVSTDEVYGSLGAGETSGETAPYAPNSPYAASKAGADHLVRAWGKTYGLPVITTNCGNNFGPRQYPEKLIPVVILKALAGEKIPVYGSGQNVRDWIYVDDHADALLHVLDQATPGAVYNIGAETRRSTLEIVHAVCALIDRLRPGPTPHSDLIEMVRDRPGHDLRYALDVSQLYRDFNWRPAHTFDTALEETVAWYLDNQDWWRPLLARGAAGARLGTSA